MTLARQELLDRRPDWGAGRRSFVSLALEPLAPAAMRQLLAGLVPGLPEPAIAAILARAEGIPLYAVETVRMLLDDHRLEEADGAYRPVGELSGLAVPESLHGLIAARLDALDPADRILLQAAAVLGQTFTLPALAAVAAEPADLLETQLKALVRREMLAVNADPRSPERGQYGFTQAVIREVAYSTLSKRDRRARHLAAARFFEGQGDEELAGVLASHYAAAYRAAPEGPEGDAIAVQARLALRGAAERAGALHDYEGALAYLAEARSVAGDPAERAAIDERAAEFARFGRPARAGRVAHRPGDRVAPLAGRPAGRGPGVDTPGPHPRRLLPAGRGDPHARAGAGGDRRGPARCRHGRDHGPARRAPTWRAATRPAGSSGRTGQSSWPSGRTPFRSSSMP